MLFEQKTGRNSAAAERRAPDSQETGGETRRPRRPVLDMKRAPAQNPSFSLQCFEAPGKSAAGLDERSVEAFDQPGTGTARRNDTGIPDGTKQRFERLSGFSLDDVRVHYHSDKPAQLQALAYTQGDQIFVAPGQEKHLLHELGHVVQQKQGRVAPSRSIGGVPVNDNPALEREADAIADASAARGEGIVQRRADGDVVQRYVTATVSADGIAQETVSSGNEQQARAEIEAWEKIKGKFDAVHSVVYPVNGKHEMSPAEEEEQAEQSESAPQETYLRNQYMCAEPFAYASALKAHRMSSLESYAVTEDWLASIRISQVTDFYESGKSRPIRPCDVCSQWLEESGAGVYSIKHAFIPTDGSENGKAKAEYLRRLQFEQDARERMERRTRERAVEAQREERELDEGFGAALASGEAAFTDDSGRIKAGLEQAFKLANVRYNSDLHERAWAGIVCEDSLPGFVRGARGIWNQLARNVDAFEQMKPDEKRRFKKDAKSAQRRYGQLCAEMAGAEKARTVLCVIRDYMRELKDEDDRDQLRESLADMDREVGAKIYAGPDEKIRGIVIDKSIVEFYFDDFYYEVNLWE